MVFEYKGEEFLTDNDLEIVSLGRYPEVVIQNEELREVFEKKYGRNFLGADEIISHRQSLVAKGMRFDSLEEEILKEVLELGADGFSNFIFDRTSKGIGSGHSMGGLGGVMLGLHGTKMIDSGLTGLVMSRSLVTSGRRRTVKQSDIVIPESITKRPDLVQNYLEISKEAFKESKKFEEKFGKSEGVEAFNKALPYNNPADLIIVLPLDTMATIVFEAMADKQNPRGLFLPRELHTLAEKLSEIAKENGMGIMNNQRVQVPRNTYLHYSVFKDPALPNYSLELAEKAGIPRKPILIDPYINLTDKFQQGIANLEKLLRETRKINNPTELAEGALKCTLASRELTSEYNEAVRATILDLLSFRVWSEQKRHATLKQNVESIHSAASRAVKKMREIWPQIEAAYKNMESKYLPIDKLEEIIVIDSKLNRDPELLIPYIYHTGRELMLYDKLVNEGIPLRDAAYMIPRNILTINLEHYDLINLLDLELPLRLCEKCEPERHKTSWAKRKLLAEALPVLEHFLYPKCSVGYCTEKDFCGHITAIRDYNQGLHQATKEAMLDKAR